MRDEGHRNTHRALRALLQAYWVASSFISALICDLCDS